MEEGSSARQASWSGPITFACSGALRRGGVLPALVTNFKENLAQRRLAEATRAAWRYAHRCAFDEMAARRWFHHSMGTFAPRVVEKPVAVLTAWRGPLLDRSGQPYPEVVRRRLNDKAAARGLLPGLYPEGVGLPSPGSRSAPWGLGTGAIPKGLHQRAGRISVQPLRGRKPRVPDPAQGALRDPGLGLHANEVWTASRSSHHGPARPTR